MEARPGATRSPLPALEAWEVELTMPPLDKYLNTLWVPSSGLRRVYPAPGGKGSGLLSRALVPIVGTRERGVEGMNGQAWAD